MEAARAELSKWIGSEPAALALPADLPGLPTPRAKRPMEKPSPISPTSRVYAGLFGEYRFTSWLALFGRIGYLADFTDFEYVGADPLLSPSASYQKFEAWLGLRVFY